MDQMMAKGQVEIDKKGKENPMEHIFPMTLTVLYLASLVFLVYMVLRFVRSIESIADSIKRIADTRESL